MFHPRQNLLDFIFSVIKSLSDMGQFNDFELPDAFRIYCIWNTFQSSFFLFRYVQFWEVFKNKLGGGKFHY